MLTFFTQRGGGIKIKHDAVILKMLPKLPAASMQGVSACLRLVLWIKNSCQIIIIKHLVYSLILITILLDDFNTVRLFFCESLK